MLGWCTSEGLRQLQSLNLGDTRVTDAGLEHLKELTELRSLDFHSPSPAYRTNVGDAGLEYLKRLTKLESLDLTYTKVTDTGTGATSKD